MIYNKVNINYDFQFSYRCPVNTIFFLSNKSFLSVNQTEIFTNSLFSKFRPNSFDIYGNKKIIIKKIKIKKKSMVIKRRSELLYLAPRIALSRDSIPQSGHI